MKKFLAKIWELMGDEKFSMTIITISVTFMTLINVLVLFIPTWLKGVMAVLNIGLIISTIIWVLEEEKGDDKR